MPSVQPAIKNLALLYGQTKPVVTLHLMKSLILAMRSRKSIFAFGVPVKTLVDLLMSIESGREGYS